MIRAGGGTVYSWLTLTAKCDVCPFSTSWRVSGGCQPLGPGSAPASASPPREREALAGASPCTLCCWNSSPGTGFLSFFFSVRNLWQRLGHLGTAESCAVGLCHPERSVVRHPAWLRPSRPRLRPASPRPDPQQGNPKLSPRKLCWVVAGFDMFTVF